MKDWIERYVYDVVRRLPEKDKPEVEKELTANIYDMLPQDPTEAQILDVLQQLGPPNKMAEQYRQNPRYLISPATFDDYARTLKYLLPIVGVVMLLLGLFVGALEILSSPQLTIQSISALLFGKSISFATSGMLQALIFTTIGFAIADRNRTHGTKQQAWQAVNLAEVPVSVKKKQIPLSDSIVELVATAIFTALFVFFATGILPVIFSFSPGQPTQVFNVFSPSFLSVSIPFIIGIGILGCIECAFKIWKRSWTPAVCAVVVFSNLASMMALVYLFTRPDIWDASLSTYLVQIINSMDAPPILLQHVANGTPIAQIMIILIAVISSLAGCGIAIYRTVKNETKKIA